MNCDYCKLNKLELAWKEDNRTIFICIHCKRYQADCNKRENDYLIGNGMYMQNIFGDTKNWPKINYNFCKYTINKDYFGLNHGNEPKLSLIYLCNCKK